MNHTFTGQPGGRCIMCQVIQSDHEIALWSKVQNRGVPHWNDLDNAAQAGWRQWYAARTRRVEVMPQVDLSQYVEALDDAARMMTGLAPCRAYEESDAALGEQEIPAEGTE